MKSVKIILLFVATTLSLPVLADISVNGNLQTKQTYKHAQYSPSSDVIESNINGEFKGWDGNTIVELTNGQIWKQSSYYYYYHYSYNPRVLIYPADGCIKMKVENVDPTVCVTRLK